MTRYNRSILTLCSTVVTVYHLFIYIYILLTVHHVMILGK